MEENEAKMDELQKAVDEAKDELNIEKKSGLKKFLAFCWKWAKRLALPIGVVIGFVLDRLIGKGGDDDDSEPAAEEATNE